MKPWVLLVVAVLIGTVATLSYQLGRSSMRQDVTDDRLADAEKAIQSEHPATQAAIEWERKHNELLAKYREAMRDEEWACADQPIPDCVKHNRLLALGKESPYTGCSAD